MVEAVQLTGTATEIYDVYYWVESHLGSVDPDSADTGVTIDPADGAMVIRTLEGDMKASPGDWIVRESDGEFWVCSHENFVKTYAPDDGSGVLVIPPGLIENLKDAFWFPTSITDKFTTVSSDPIFSLEEPREKLRVRVDRSVEIIAERIAAPLRRPAAGPHILIQNGERLG